MSDSGRSPEFEARKQAFDAQLQQVSSRVVPVDRSSGGGVGCFAIGGGIAAFLVIAFLVASWVGSGSDTRSADSLDLGGVQRWEGSYRCEGDDLGIRFETSLLDRDAGGDGGVPIGMEITYLTVPPGDGAETLGGSTAWAVLDGLGMRFVVTDSTDAASHVPVSGAGIFDITSPGPDRFAGEVEGGSCSRFDVTKVG